MVVPAPPQPVPPPVPHPVPPPGLALADMAPIGARTWVGRLAPGIWATSFTHRMDDGTVYPANGLVLERRGRCVLVDPGWEAAQARALLGWIQGNGWRAVKAVVTHSHADRAAGIATLRRAGVPVLGLARTAELLKREGKPAPDPVPGLENAPYADPLGFELFFPGAGHAPDNLVVWILEGRVLYGGCFLKDARAAGLGNVADADLDAWPAALDRVAARWPDIAIQVPGHGPIGGDALARTRALLAALNPSADHH